jgi:hypothetical protein
MTPEGTSNPQSGEHFLPAPEEELLLAPPVEVEEAVTESSTVQATVPEASAAVAAEPQKLGWGPNDRFPHDWAQG